MDQFALRKNKMNQQSDSSINQSRLQENVVNATFIFSTIKQHLGDIEAQAVAAKALCEIMYDELDAIDGQGIVNAAVRIDALVKATHRNAVLIQESVEAAGLVLLDAEGGDQ